MLFTYEHIKNILFTLCVYYCDKIIQWISGEIAYVCWFILYVHLKFKYCLYYINFEKKLLYCLL